MILVKPSYEILTEVNGSMVRRRIERAGRICYKSEGNISVNSAEQFVEKIISNGHHSVLEHESLSVLFVCDRGITHEIVRHRLAAYSQESTRYCNYKGGVTFIIPPWVGIEPGAYMEEEKKEFNNIPDAMWYQTMINAELTYQGLLCKWSPQQARSVLPNSLKTEIVMTANLREWRHVLKLRTSKAAHPQMQELMIPLLKELQTKIPIIFDDLGV